MGWQSASSATLGANATLPKWNAFGSLKESDLYAGVGLDKLLQKARVKRYRILIYHAGLKSDLNQVELLWDLEPKSFSKEEKGLNNPLC